MFWEKKREAYLSRMEEPMCHVAALNSQDDLLDLEMFQSVLFQYLVHNS